MEVFFDVMKIAQVAVNVFLYSNSFKKYLKIYVININ